VKGEPATDIFEDINTTWLRVKGGEKIKPLVEKLIKDYNYEKPAASIPLLFQLRKAIQALEPGVWKTRKLQEVEQLIQDCAGLYIELTASYYWASPAAPFIATIELLNRSDVPVEIIAMRSADLGIDSVLNLKLSDNVPVVFRSRKSIAVDKAYSSPYWLREPHPIGLFTVKDEALVGKPANDAAVMVDFKVNVAGSELLLTKPVVFRSTDPVKGEQYRPFEVVPPVFVTISNGVWVFHNDSPKEVGVVVKSSVEGALAGRLKLQLPEGWRSEPAFIDFAFNKMGEEQFNTFKVFPSKAEMTGTLRAVAEINGVSYSYSLQTISYDHIPTQTLLPKAEVKAVRMNLKKEGKVIGYIKGAGDDVPSALRNMGYEVWEMKGEEVTTENLKRVDAVVLGIRALNTNDRIRFIMNDLLDYVKNGGTMVVQYNTNNGLQTDKFSPYPLTLSRERVTEENSEVRILKPDHPVLNFPNKITATDFSGWVQERGLYFPNKWDDQFEAILSMNDANDKPSEGSLLVAGYGQGYYVYTGLSFFRELPEGVPGAYKLFANLVSLRAVKEGDVKPKKKR
jgi:hypothetical protein